LGHRSVDGGRIWRRVRPIAVRIARRVADGKERILADPER